jgi:drug/metabolite transporter (DMT)-like permease
MNDTTCDTAVAAPPSTLFGPRFLVPAALFSLYLIWGSTYLAIRVALESYPPFLMAGVRFLVAGGAFYAFLRWRGMAAPTRAQWLNAAITGTLLLGMGNGLVCYAEQSVASGLAAVAVAAMPLFAALFGGLYGQWPRRMEWLGLGVGFAGVVLLNLGGGMAGATLGAIALLVAAMAWAFGSVWSRRRNMPPAAMNTAAQMLTGGAVLCAGALLFGERFPAAPSTASTLSLL